MHKAPIREELEDPRAFLKRLALEAKYEYKLITFTLGKTDVETSDLEKKLKELEKEGWRIFSNEIHDPKVPHILLERPKSK